MRYHHLLFLLFNTFSLLLSLAPLQYNLENKSYGNTNRNINFSGKFYYTLRARTINKVNYEYVSFIFYSTINGFLVSYHFKLNFAEPSYVYMICTVPSSSGITYNIECELDNE